LSKPRPEQAGADARAAAARAVARVVAARESLDDALAAVAAGASSRDAALVAALVYGALRFHQRLEWQLRELSNRPLTARDAELAALVRIGLFQLQETRIPDHAAVSATVEAAALIDRRNAAGFVNAVLRRFLRERAALDARMTAVPEARRSHPAWLIAELRRDWPDGWQAALAAGNELPPMWLRVNLLRTTRDAYLERLGAAGWPAEAAPQVATAVLLTRPATTAELPGFAAGEVSVQDAAAQLAPLYLDLRPGQRVLDACAAPGGKTCHIVEHCPEVAEVVALDRDAARLELVAENVERLELERVRLVAADAARPESWWDGRPFDRILVDAPCSATGVIRRHPDIKVLRRPQDVTLAVERQAALLEALWPLLAAGGRLVYSTCSVLRRENADLAAGHLPAGPDLDANNKSVDLPSSTAEGLAAEAAAPAGERQILTGEARMDGFYYAWRSKPETLQTPSVSISQQRF
jgi:16S rRNA (cytosine967-C5)-methyltransferase